MKTNPFLRNLFLLLTCVLFAWSACSDDDPEPDPVLSVSQQNVNFEASPTAAQTVNVTANLAWSVSVTQTGNWLSVTPASGEGNGTVNITATANTGEQRTATLTFSGGKAQAVTMNVTQAAYENEAEKQIEEIVNKLEAMEGIAPSFIEELKAIDMQEAGETKFTVFAVGQSSSDKLSAANATSDKDVRRQVINGVYAFSDLVDGTTLTALNNDKLAVKIIDQVVYINGVEINSTPVISGNNTIYVVASYFVQTVVAVNQIAINPDKLTLDIGQTQTIQAAITPENATYKQVTWSVPSNNIISYIADGNELAITAQNPGTVTVTATSAEGQTTTCTVTVNAVSVTSVTLDQANATLTVGNTLTLTATVAPDNATDKTVSWTSSDPAVATVTNGVVNALSHGTAVITVTTQDGNQTATCTVTVPEPMQMTISMTTQKSGEVEFSLYGTGTPVIIDWGDGTEPETSTFYYQKSFTHNYSDASERTITIIGENMTYLYCANQSLTSLDVSKNTALKELLCNRNNLQTVDVSKNTELTMLQCGSNPFITLNVSNNTLLEELRCQENQLTSLDLSNNPLLTELICFDNQLTSLSVSNNIALEDLDCEGNQLSAAALNALFGTLHSNTLSREKRIYISSNPGASTCDRSLATAKGWTFR